MACMTLKQFLLSGTNGSGKGAPRLLACRKSNSKCCKHITDGMCTKYDAACFYMMQNPTAVYKTFSAHMSFFQDGLTQDTNTAESCCIGCTGREKALSGS